MRAIGYIRVSSQVQAEKGESLATQRSQIEAFISTKSWTLSKIYEDAGRSGGNTNRPGLKSLMNDVTQGGIDVVIVARLSRFARNTRDLLNKVEELKNHNVQFASIKESIDLTNPYGKFMLTMLAGVAELERETIREQTLENKMVRWRDKKIFPARSPFAYRWDKEKSKFFIVKKEAEIYKRIVEMYLSGLAMKNIAIRLKDEGIKHRTAWFSGASIRYILKSSAYYGRLFTNRLEYKLNKKTGRYILTGKEKPRDQWIIFDTPPIISKNKWDQIQERITNNRAKGKYLRPETKKSWLRDSLICECGGVIKPRFGKPRKDGTRYRYYRCFWSRASEKDLKYYEREKCQMPLISAEELENFVWNGFIDPIRTLMNPHRVKPLIDTNAVEKKQADYESRIKSLEAEHRGIKLAIRRLLESLKKPDLPDLVLDTLVPKLDDLENEKITILEKINEIKTQKDNLEETVKNNNEYQRFIQGNQKELRSLVYEIIRLPPEYKKRLFEASHQNKIKVIINLEYMRIENPDKPKNFSEYEIISEGKWRIKWPEQTYDGTLNIAILKQFMDENVIGNSLKLKESSKNKLKQKRSYDVARYR